MDAKQLKEAKKYLITKAEGLEIVKDLEAFIKATKKKYGKKVESSLGISASIMCITENETIGEHAFGSGSDATFERIALHAVIALAEKDKNRSVVDVCAELAANAMMRQ